MTRIAAEIVVDVPAERCQHAVQAALEDERILEAYRQLRSGKEYSGWVTAVTPGRWLEISFAALDPRSGRRTHRLGWCVTYEFVPVDDGRTRVVIAVEYGVVAALAAAGTMRAQAENEISHRLLSMHALEVGVRGGAIP